MSAPLEPHWIDAFEALIRRCAVQPGDTIAVLCETQSRAALPELARLVHKHISNETWLNSFMPTIGI